MPIKTVLITEQQLSKIFESFSDYEPTDDEKNRFFRNKAGYGNNKPVTKKLIGTQVWGLKYGKPEVESNWDIVIEFGNEYNNAYAYAKTWIKKNAVNPKNYKIKSIYKYV